MDLILLDIKMPFMSVLYMGVKFVKFHFFTTLRTFVLLCHNNKYNTYVADKSYQIITVDFLLESRDSKELTHSGFNKLVLDENYWNLDKV